MKIILRGRHLPVSLKLFGSVLWSGSAVVESGTIMLSFIHPLGAKNKAAFAFRLTYADRNILVGK
jgi:hypothetical protein